MSAVGLLAAAALAQPPAPANPAAEALFVANCKSCHEPPVERAPTRADFRQRTADNILEAITSGGMQAMASGLTADQKRQLAVYLAGRPIGAPAPVTIKDVPCATQKPIRPGRADSLSWGQDEKNSRFQTRPGLRAADVPKLKVKWAFSYRAGAYGQPTVIGDHLFITSQGGGFYSIDARTGCIYWKVETVPPTAAPGVAAPVPAFSSRTTPMIVRRPDIAKSGWVTFIAGTGNRVFAYDLQDGSLIWRSEPLETVGRPRLTGSPIVHGDQVFAPVSSLEEVEGAGACCEFRGSLVALDIRTGRQTWKTFVITEPRVNTRVNARGVQLFGPGGAAIWSAPTVDAKRNLVYVATGDSYSEAPTKGADAIIAMDMTTGAIKWTTQVTEGDNFIVGCNRPPRPINCGTPAGPDWDFGASPLLARTPKGKDLVISGQKSGVVYAMEPETGRIVWQTRVGAGSTLGGVEWGIAADRRYVYVPNSDLIIYHELALQKAGRPSAYNETPAPTPRPGVSALDLDTGREVWHAPTPVVDCHFVPGASRTRIPNCFNVNSQAATVIPGVVFAGSHDGRLRGYDTKTGRIVWTFDTTGQTYDTVNGVKSQPGGSLDSVGPTIANGRLYVMSGYAGSAECGSNNPNVLLAFSVDGK